MSPILLLLAGIAVFWLSVLARVALSRRDTRYKLGPDAPVREELPPLLAVIPARDEARNIVACLRSIRASDHPGVHILVFDDGSTDGTAELARAEGVEVVDGGGGALPAGWKGKPWALERARAHFGDATCVVFIDADVRLHPTALSRLHTYAINESVDLLSGFGRLEMGSFWEHVIQPSVGGLILAGNDLAKVNDEARREKAIANGQLILVRRAAYDQVGGHAAVKDNILDDIGIAKAFKAAGFRVRCLLLRELFSCRMYTGFSELWHGWTKNLFPGMEFKLGVVALVVGLVVVEFLAPYAILVWAAITGDVPALCGALGVLALMHGVRAWMDRLFGQPLAYGLLQPLGATLLVGLLLDSVRRTRSGTRTWKGRTY